MSQAENRQLLFAGAAALLVLGLGGFFWFGATSPQSPTEPLDASNFAIEETQRPGPSAADAAPDRKKVAPPPSLVAGLKHPSVRPPEQANAVFQALGAIEPSYQACFKTTLDERPGSKGRAILQFDVDAGELASQVGVELRAIPSPALQACFAKATLAADFAAVQGKTRVLWPLLMWHDERGLTVQPPVHGD